MVNSVLESFRDTSWVPSRFFWQVNVETLSLWASNQACFPALNALVSHLSHSSGDADDSAYLDQ